MPRMKLLPLAIGLALAGAACAADATVDQSSRDDGGTVVEGGDVGVFVLQVGDCFDDPDDFANVASVAAVPCTELHDNQVYAKFDLPDGGWPGDVAVQDMAVNGCLDRFEPAVGQQYETSPLDIAPLFPSVDTWGTGDREVICALYNVDFSKLTGSVLT